MNHQNDFLIKELLDSEINAIRNIPINNPFNECAELFVKHNKIGGQVIISGVGKAGEVGKKIATTFCSVGISSVFLHPLEAQHGDLGLIHNSDILLLISNSGKTREIIELNILAHKLYNNLPMILITGNKDSELAKNSNYTLWNGNPKEICPLGLVPTTSTTTMAVIGDILSVLLMKIKNFTPADYALRHHSGYLGEKSRNMK